MNRPLRIQMVRQTGMTAMFNVVTLANHLSKAGHQVKMTCIEPECETVPGLSTEVSVCGLGAGSGKGIGKLWAKARGALRLRRHLNQQSFDILYVLDSWTLPALWVATTGKLRWPGARVVYHTFDWLEPRLVAESHRRLEAQMCRKADLVVNTDRARARLQQTLYGLRDRPLWVQNCLASSTQIPAPNEALRREMAGVSDTAALRILLYPTIVSNSDSAQRLTWELIQAFKLLPQHYRLVLFYKEGSEYRRCVSLCASLGIADRVKFLQPLPFLRLLEYVVSADCGAILYDDRMSSGYFMCNADKLSLFAACGIPFVASDQPNLEAVTYRYGLGECCDPHDAEALAMGVRKVTDETVPLAERKCMARKAFLDHLNFEVQGRGLIAKLATMKVNS